MQKYLTNTKHGSKVRSSNQTNCDINVVDVFLLSPKSVKTSQKRCKTKSVEPALTTKFKNYPLEALNLNKFYRKSIM
jgi:hypothetical protein